MSFKARVRKRDSVAGSLNIVVKTNRGNLFLTFAVNDKGQKYNLHSVVVMFSLLLMLNISV